MTNREFFAENPNELNGNILQNAREYVKENFKEHEWRTMSHEKMINIYLDAPHQNHEITFVQTIQITSIYRDGLRRNPIVPDITLKLLKDSLSADDISISRVQYFIRGE